MSSQTSSPQKRQRTARLSGASRTMVVRMQGAAFRRGRTNRRPQCGQSRSAVGVLDGISDNRISRPGSLVKKWLDLSPELVFFFRSPPNILERVL